MNSLLFTEKTLQGNNEENIHPCKLKNIFFQINYLGVYEEGLLRALHSGHC